MKPHRLLLLHVASLVAVGALLGLGLLAPAAFAASTSKPYAAVVSPDPAFVGSTTTYTVTLTNETDTQTLGSANVSGPSAFTLLAAHDVVPGGTATVSGSTVQLRNLNVPPGGSASVQVDAQAPCHAATYTWSSIAKQSNNFSGPPGNNLFLDPATSHLTTTLAGSCTMSFLREPASAQVSTNLTSVTYDPTGDAVQAAVLDGSGAVIARGPLSTTVASLSIATNPSGGHLSASGATAAGGVTTFPSLSIDASGVGYTLRASLDDPDVLAADSTAFDIQDVGKQCGAGPCGSGLVTKGSTTAEENAPAGSAGDLLSLSVAIEPLDCAGYVESSSVATFSVTNRSKVVTITLAKNAVTHSVSTYQVCYSSPTPFVDRTGATTSGPALLPDCDVAAAPCVQSRDVVRGAVRLTFAAPAGDPKGRL